MAHVCRAPPRRRPVAAVVLAHSMESQPHVNREQVTALIKTLKKEQHELENQMKQLMSNPNPLPEDAELYKQLKNRHVSVRQKKSEVQNALNQLAEQGPEEFHRKSCFVQELKDGHGTWEEPSETTWLGAAAPASQPHTASVAYSASGAADAASATCGSSESEQANAGASETEPARADGGGQATTASRAQLARRQEAREKASEEDDFRRLHPNVQGQSPRSPASIEMERASEAMEHLQKDAKQEVEGHPVSGTEHIL